MWSIHAAQSVTNWQQLTLAFRNSLHIGMLCRASRRKQSSPCYVLLDDGSKPFQQSMLWNFFLDIHTKKGSKKSHRGSDAA
jgi:hypothetical protein